MNSSALVTGALPTTGRATLTANTRAGSSVGCASGTDSSRRSIKGVSHSEESVSESSFVPASISGSVASDGSAVEEAASGEYVDRSGLSCLFSLVAHVRFRDGPNSSLAFSRWRLELLILSVSAEKYLSVASMSRSRSRRGTGSEKCEK